jgi:cytoskeletal protein CcmA (bactofilin family)
MRKRRLLERYRGASHWSDQTTVIGPRFTLSGEIETEDAVVVAGRMEGPIRTRDIVHVLAGAVVLGSIEARAAVVEGAVEGPMAIVEELELGHTARVRGDLDAGLIAIGEGAFHQGHLRARNGTVTRFREQRKLRQ